MDFFLVILIMLGIIGLSNVINHIVPFIPVPMIQIVLGVMIATIPEGINMHLEPDLFFVLFIAPILFNDGKNVSRTHLWNLRKQIFLLALGLVFFTVLAIGYLTHWLIPTIPLSAGFALAAILSPTDIVAVSAMSSRVRMPKSVMHLLAGEGLMNDASGLIAFNFAVAATVTGAFSLVDAGWSFLNIAIGGFAGGAFLAIVIIQLRVLIRRMGMEDVTFHMLIQILTPFLIFLAIEHLHLSGILAVVAAGIVHAVERDHEASPVIHLQVVSKSTWTVLLYVLNGLVFVLLGLQIPDILNELFKNPELNNMAAVGYAAVITAALFLLRFIWLYLFGVARWILSKAMVAKPDIRMIAITTISGVRGAVTLAGAFSIPFVLADGSLFPERSLIIFIAAGVILLTLAAASILLPVITKPEKDKLEKKKEEMISIALIRTQKSAIRAIREVLNENNREAALAVISKYNRVLQQLQCSSPDNSCFDSKDMETEIRMKALEAESQYIAKLVEENQINIETSLQAQALISRLEVAATNRLKFRFLVIWSYLRRGILQIGKIFVLENSKLSKEQNRKKEEMILIKIGMGEAAIQTIRDGLTPQNKDISFKVIGEYNDLITKVKSARSEHFSQTFSQMERDIQGRAFQAERDEIQKLYEDGKITKEVTQEIRRQINIREAYFIEEKNA